MVLLPLLLLYRDPNQGYPVQLEFPQSFKDDYHTLIYRSPIGEFISLGSHVSSTA